MNKEGERCVHVSLNNIQVSQEARSIFWEVIVPVILRKNCYPHVSYSERFPRFRSEVPIWLIRKRYYVLFLIPVFFVQVAKLVQFTKYNAFSKIPRSTSTHFAVSCEDMVCCSSVQ
jgi:hypothetical protein